MGRVGPTCHEQCDGPGRGVASSGSGPPGKAVAGVGLMSEGYHLVWVIPSVPMGSENSALVVASPLLRLLRPAGWCVDGWRIPPSHDFAPSDDREKDLEHGLHSCAHSSYSPED